MALLPTPLSCMAQGIFQKKKHKDNYRQKIGRRTTILFTRHDKTIANMNTEYMQQQTMNQLDSMYQCLVTDWKGFMKPYKSMLN